MAEFEVVIIGSGIGGLVAGCYLAKRGIKTAIVEKHNTPGGYCTSFSRSGFSFDTGVHYLSSLRKGGVLNRILSELEILKDIEFIECDPTDRIITPDKTLHIYKNRHRLLDEFITAFPKEESNIRKFFEFVLDSDYSLIYAKTKKLSYIRLLDSFFLDNKLKAVLSAPLGCIGVSPLRASALVAVILIKEFIIDGGYYPRGGIQKLPDMLAEKFSEMGGRVLLRKNVTKILTKRNRIVGVEIDDECILTANVVISNVDATLTFNNLLEKRTKERLTVENLKTSTSAFVAYLGLNTKTIVKPIHYVTWYFPNYNIDAYFNSYAPDTNQFDYLICSLPTLVDPSLAPAGKSIIKLMVGATFGSKNAWDRNRQSFCEKLIRTAEEVLPVFHDRIELKITATPYTFERYTNNYKGALFGWEAIPSQTSTQVFPGQSSIKGLFLAGHWVTNGPGQSGIPIVALSGRSAAYRVLKNLRG